MLAHRIKSIVELIEVLLNSDHFVTGGMDPFGRALLEAHNKYRAKHGSPKLKWSSEAAKKAQEWADHLARSGTLQHGGHEGMGQNLAYKSGAELSAEEAAAQWYDENKNYDYSHPGFAGNTGHFTQMVWASTTHMGAGKAVKGRSTYVVANYVPPGNITNPGFFERNVKKPS